MTDDPILDGIATSLSAFGGVLRCEVCAHRQPLGSIKGHLSGGWPRHCGYTMRWWTQRQIDAGEISDV